MAAYDYSLLIEKYKDELLRTIERNHVTLIKGPTGCGKSTFVPLLFKNSKMAIIEPRRIAVTSLYNTLAPHIPNLGYKMRFNKKIGQNTKAVIYTDGSFLNEADMLGYEYIIVDEVHERSLRTDAILSILKDGYKGKLILMSASIDSRKLEQYFGAKTYEVPGNSNPMEIHYLSKPTSDYIVEAFMTVRKILKSRPSGEKKDVLIFLPGEEDINELFQLCRKLPGVVALKIHSSMGDSEQQKIYKESSMTRIILSTNICETSLTIPNVKYVIDTGLCKTKIYNGVNHLGIQAISKDSAIQRAGRCNRLGAGVCYRLYTEFELLPTYQPEIRRTDLSTLFLILINQKKNILNFNFIDFPPLANCVAALMFLMSKGCIELIYKNSPLLAPEMIVAKDGYADYTQILKAVTFRITSYGKRLVLHPFDVHFANFYELSIQKGIGYYGSILLSLISQENYNFMNPRTKTLPDILYLVDLFEKYAEAGDKVKFAIKNGISYKGMEAACRAFKTLNKKKDGTVENLERVFSDAFKHNLCIREKDGSFKMVKNGLQVFIHPSSAFFKRNDKKIVVADVFCTTKTYARIVGKYFE